MRQSTRGRASRVAACRRSPPVAPLPSSHATLGPRSAQGPQPDCQPRPWPFGQVEAADLAPGPILAGRLGRPGGTPFYRRRREGRSLPAPRVDAVIVAYNSARTLRACVEPLAAIDGVRVFVVDNCSPDDTAAPLAGLDVELVRAPRNGGFSAGCNLGIARGAAPYVLLLNPDARMSADALDALVAVLDANPGDGDRRPADRRGRRLARPEPAPLPAAALDVRAGALPSPALAARVLDRRAGPRSCGLPERRARPTGSPAPAC